MVPVNKEKKALIHLAILIGSLFIIQGLGRYFSDSLMLFDSFNGLLFLTRFGIPISLLLFILPIPWSALGLKFYPLSKKWIVFCLIVLFVVPLIQSLILLDESYQSYYSYYTNASIPSVERLKTFSLFTLSTFFAWEFLHRAYCLFGIRYLLAEKLKVSASTAAWVAILWTSSFEVFFHFQKPPLEAFGLMIAAPLWSWISLKTRSIWVAVGIHFYIEALFISFMIFGTN